MPLNKENKQIKTILTIYVNSFEYVLIFTNWELLVNKTKFNAKKGFKIWFEDFVSYPEIQLYFIYDFRKVYSTKRRDEKLNKEILVVKRH